MATSCDAPPAPRLLKDFLQDQTTAATSRKTRFNKATEVFINAVKFLPFKSVKPPSLLPRSISRRLSRSRKRETYHYDIKEVSITVKVKDILRWKSFRDLAEDQAAPLDLAAAASPSRCTATTATGTSTSSGRSSWCDSDFTAEDLPSWVGESEALAGENEIELKCKKCLPVKTVGSYLIRATTGIQLKVEMLHDEEESHTPVSVLDFPFQEEESSSSSSFHQTFSNKEIMKIKEFKGLEKPGNWFFMDEKANRIEEKANELVNCAKTTCSIGGCDEDVDHCLLLDFFRHELITSRNLNGGDQFDAKLLRMAKAWLRGEDDGSLEWEMEGKREICVGEIERGERWNKFEEEQEEMTVEMEITLLNSLLEELVIDLISH